MVHSHQAKTEAKAKKIKEKDKNIKQRRQDNFKKIFAFVFAFVQCERASMELKN